ncbi:MAG: glycosyltransferase family 39 protein [Gemmatimonadaceae bacterium]
MSDGSRSASGAWSLGVTEPIWVAGADGSRVTPLALAALTALCVVMSIGSWPVGVFQDDGIYMVLAKSLATGEGYRFLQMPGAPNATHYPPLYPAFLSLLWRIWPQFPENVVLFKYANAVWLSVTAVGTYRFAKQWAGFGEAAAILTTVAFVSCAPLMLLSVMVLSEPMFLALMIPTLIAAERATRSGRWRDAAVAGCAIGALSMIRSLGALVAPAALAVLLWRRHWRGAGTLVLATACTIAPWQWWVSVHAHEVPAIYLGKYGSYFGWWTDAIRTEGLGWLGRVAAHNLRMLTEQGWASTASEGMPLLLRVLATVALTGFFLGGLLRLLRRLPTTALFVAAYFLMVVVWPFAPARFTWGVWPFVGMCYALSVQWAWGLARSPETHQLKHRMLLAARFALAGAAAALFVGYVGYNVKGVTHHWWDTVQQSVADRAHPLAEWTLANTKPTDILATDDDVLIHLYTGRRTIPTGAFTAQEHVVPQTKAFASANLRTILHTFPVDWVLASTEYGTYAVNGLIVERPPEIRIVAVLKTGAVFAPTALGRPRATP